jgi:hypothetical protein
LQVQHQISLSAECNAKYINCPSRDTETLVMRPSGSEKISRTRLLTMSPMWSLQQMIRGRSRLTTQLNYLCGLSSRLIASRLQVTKPKQFSMP